MNPPHHETIETNKAIGKVQQGNIEYAPNDNIKEIIQHKLVQKGFGNFEWVSKGIDGLDDTILINNEYQVHFYKGFPLRFLFTIIDMADRNINPDSEDYKKIRNAVKDSFEGIQIAGAPSFKNLRQGSKKFLTSLYKMASRKNMTRRNRKNVSRKNRKNTRKNRKASRKNRK